MTSLISTLRVDIDWGKARQQKQTHKKVGHHFFVVGRFLRLVDALGLLQVVPGVAVVAVLMRIKLPAVPFPV
jgi:hypothetical protein